MKKDVWIKFLNIIFSVAAFLGLTVGTVMLFYNIYHSVHTTAKNNVTSLYEKSVLFLSSYNGMYSYTQQEIEGVEEVFMKNGISYSAEFLDTKTHECKENVQNFYEYLKEKMKIFTSYDAVILGDDMALKFALKHQDELFANIPLVFLGVNDISLAKQAASNPYVTGITEQIPFEELMTLAKVSFPGCRKMYVLVDNLISTGGNRKQFENIMHAYEDEYEFKMIDLEGLSFNEFCLDLSLIKADSIILNLGSYCDYDGKIYTPYQMIKEVQKYSSAPIITVFNISDSKGVLGGVSSDHRESGRIAAQMVADILHNNVEPSSLSVKESVPGNIVVDWDTLNYYGLSGRKIARALPGNTFFVNRPKSFMALYSHIIIPCFFIIASCMLLVMVLVIYSFKLRKARNVLRIMVSHDTLTGLPNREVGLTAIKGQVVKNKVFSIVSIDMDNFQHVNDFYSQEFGNSVLQELAKRFLRLRQFVNGLDVYRFGGDEFFLIVRNEILVDGCETLNLIQNAVEDVFKYKDKEIKVKGSIGVVTSSENLHTSEEYVKASDIARSEAKKNAKGTITFYDSKLSKAVSSRHDILEELKRACEEDGFKVVYQPQVETATKTIIGYEALLRLKSGRYSPGEFIPVAEEDIDLMKRIGRIVTQKVIDAMASWKKSGMELLKVSINYSVSQMHDTSYVSWLKKIMEENGIPSELICIEITESMLLEDREHASEVFEEFTSLGVRLALDDFGTGYSSFNYLTFIPVKYVKLDKSVVDTYLKQGEFHVVKNLISFVHGLNKSVIIEGIEEKWQVDKISEIDGDIIQGYYYGKPLEFGDIQKLKKWNLVD